MSPFLKISLLAGTGLLTLGAVVAVYYLYAPAAPMPVLRGQWQAAQLRVGERLRCYHAYVPPGLAPGRPLLLILHGSNQDGPQIRRWTGYGFDQLADRYGFAVLYPDGYQGNWNDCRRDASYPAKVENVDDMGFLRALVAHYQIAIGSDPRRIFAFGYSSGGQMAFRLAIEEPRLVAAIATAGANLPTPATCSCPPVGPTARVLLVAGTNDPISPYAGGKVTLFGLAARGTARSAQATAEVFAQRNGVSEPAVVKRWPVRGSTEVTRQLWSHHAEPVVAFYTVRGGGHVVPQPAFRFPRLLGSTATDLDTPARAVAFFGIQ